LPCSVFTRRFGEIEFSVFGERWSVPGSPEIVVVSNATEEGRPIGVRRAGENWHSDMCYTARPPRGTILYALEISDLFGLTLGDTAFANAAEVWDALPKRISSGSMRHVAIAFTRLAWPSMFAKPVGPRRSTWPDTSGGEHGVRDRRHALAVARPGHCQRGAAVRPSDTS
jgi:hypothetical protein